MTEVTPTGEEENKSFNGLDSLSTCLTPTDFDKVVWKK